MTKEEKKLLEEILERLKRIEESNRTTVPYYPNITPYPQFPQPHYPTIVPYCGDIVVTYLANKRT